MIRSVKTDKEEFWTVDVWDHPLGGWLQRLDTTNEREAQKKVWDLLHSDPPLRVRLYHQSTTIYEPGDWQVDK